MRYLILIIFSLVAQVSEGRPWVMEPPNSLNQVDINYLKQRFPEVNSGLELQQLLQSIGRLRPMQKAEAESDQTGNVLRIKLRSAALVRSIEVDSTAYRISNEISDRLRNFVGLPLSSQLVAKIRKRTVESLQRRGLYQAQIEIKENLVDGQAEIEIRIKENFPCRLRSIRFGFDLPKGAEFQLKPGSICDQDRISDAVEELSDDLLELGYNQRSLSRHRLIYHYQENSGTLLVAGELGKRIQFRVITPITDLLSEELTVVDGTLEDPGAVKAEMEARYRKAGYDDVVVDEPKLVRQTENLEVYDVEIEPGEPYFVTSIQFEGNYSFEHGELADLLEYEGLFSAPLYREQLERDKENIQDFYVSRGFWKAQVKQVRVSKSSSGSAVSFIISEGKKRYLNRIEVEGNQRLTTQEIEALLKTNDDSSFSWQNLSDFQKQLSNSYRSQGLLYASFDMKINELPAFRRIPVNVSVKIDEGKQVYFGDTTISGLVATDREVVSRELRYSLGDAYDPQLIEQTRAALVRLGIFSSVDIAVADGQALSEKRRNLPHIITVREAKPGNIAFGPGWSLESGLRYVVETSYSNIGGTGRRVYSRLKVSEEKEQEWIGNKTLLGRNISAGYVEPYILGLPADAMITANHSAKAVQQSWEIGESAELSLYHVLRKYIPGARIGGFYGQEITTIEAREQETKPLITTGDVRIGRLGARFEIDKRDDLTWTRSGFKLLSEYSVARFALGGNLAYQKGSLEFSHFFALSDDLVIASGFSWVTFRDLKRNGVAADVLPTSERLFAGGSETNRGFVTRSLGPYFRYFTPNGDEFEERIEESGGSTRRVYKLELRYQLIEQTLGLAYFVDSSNVSFSDQQLSAFSAGFQSDFESQGGAGQSEPDSIEENYHHSGNDVISDLGLVIRQNYVAHGLALNWLTPIGSIDLSYGIPLSRCPIGVSGCGRERGRGRENGLLFAGVFHVSIGASL